MKRMETIRIVVYYCDYCKKKIEDHTHCSYEVDGKEDTHYHTVHKTGVNKTCHEKFEEEWLEEWLEEYRLKRKTA